MHSQQVFQANSRKRWKSFLWLTRSIIFISCLLIFSFVFALLRRSNTHLPKLIETTEEYKKLSKPEKPIGSESFEKKYHNKKVNLKRVDNPNGIDIRAAFYVNWDLQSYTSLKNNYSKINMLLPEWFFISPTGDTLSTDIDQRVLPMLQKDNKVTMPLLSNYSGNAWNGNAVNRIFTDPKKAQQLISQVIAKLDKYHFKGICLDFEELDSLKDDAVLINFEKNLYTQLHAHGYLLGQCISPGNEDYPYEKLEKYNDYIFVMAYDQHFPTSTPGAISEAQWVDKIMKSMTASIPPEKFVLCLASYGYDWLKGGTGLDVTYEEAVTIAKESEGKIIFDNDNYNLHFNYFDDADQEHEVWFTDAATNFNIMRSAADYGVAGVAIWRLGSEDPRLWNFYNKPMSRDSNMLGADQLYKFENIIAPQHVDYIGEGEVLNIIATPQQGKVKVEVDPKDKLITGENYLQLPTSYVIKKYGRANPKEIMFTFDDGPDPKYTPEILKILKKEHVPAAFFVIGQNAENNLPIVEDIYNGGFELGNHTFSHPNLAEVSKERAALEINATRRIIEAITNHSTVLFRPPFNADAEPQDLAEIIPVQESRKDNYITVGESIDPQDWDEKKINSDSIYNRVLRQLNLGSIILLHDAGGDRSATVEALPKLIKYFKANGYKFISVSDLLQKTPAELMPPLASRKEIWMNKVNFYFASSFFWTQHFIYALFFFAIILAMGRTIFIALLAIIQYFKTKKRKINKDYNPMVDIIVPAHNENVNVIKTIHNLLKSDYANTKIIFVNDGSKDNTLEIVQNEFSNHSKVIILDKINGGKASALNYGINHSDAEIVVCIDADTQLKFDAVSRLVESFVNEDIGAVAGNVKVGNLVNMLTNWQFIEYTTAQNFDRRAFELLNCITVVPGAIGAFKREAILEVGGLTSDTLAEDCDLTIKLLKNGYKIVCCNEAIAYTESPETMQQFIKQRFRWCFGVMQVFWKNRETCFYPKYKALGLIALPNILLYQFFLPFFAPIADLIMIFGLFTGASGNFIWFYLGFQLIDLISAFIAFRMENEDWRKLWMVIPQRFSYRWIMYIVYFKALSRAIKGEMQAWGVLKRTGNVKEIDTEIAALS
ncbi:MAG: glycosyltransferase [Bacteroidota bacterium]|nr:glycosyltransferase [Bacteroidota bacterium]